MRANRNSAQRRFPKSPNKAAQFLQPSNRRDTKRIDSPTETVGEIFADDSIIELVRGDSKFLQLLFWDGSKARISSEVKKGGKTFVPPTAFEQEVLQAVRLPRHPRPYGTTEQLTDNLHNWFAQHPGLPDESISILVCFTLCTLFREFIEVLPALSVVAPDPSNSALLLRLLECVCWHSLRVVEASNMGVFALPSPLHRTILLDQEKPTKRLQGTLRAMGYPGGLIRQNGQYHDISCPIVICSGQPLGEPAPPNVIQVVLMPSRGCLPRIEWKSLREAGDELQGKLLQYRLVNFKRVRESKFNPNGLHTPLAETARSVGACIVDHPKLQSHIVELLKPQDEDRRIRHSTGIPEVVIEVAFTLCHQGNRSSIYVSEFADASNAVLENRKEIIRLEPRAVGDVLRNIGLFTERLGSAGRGIRLLNEIRRKIHRLAYSYDVLSMRDGVDRCEFCVELRETAASK